MSLRNLLEEKVGTDAAGRVMTDIDFAYRNGKRGQDLVKHFEASMAQAGHHAAAEKSGVLYAFIRVD